MKEDKQLVEESEVAKRFGMERVDNLLEMDFIRLKTPPISYSLVKEKGVLPLEKRGDRVLIAVANPLDFEAVEEIRQVLSAETVEVFAPKEAMEAAIEHCYQQEDRASHLMESLSSEEDTLLPADLEGYDLLDHKADSPVIKILNAIFLEAIQQGASDIHFEPQEEGLNIRYRIDGVLQPKHIPSKEYQAQLTTRIKVLAALDIAEQRLPQDGRIKMRMGGRQIDFRVSTIPCVFGERIVLRILDKTNVLLGLDKIGLKGNLMDRLKRLIHLPEGIVLVTGPTGSGKTTTLYSALADVNSSSVNIMTIEDPVEYKLPAMAQIGVNPKIQLSFATGLRHILRQDPDIIMIGEIRDKETAEIAIQASLTGHLVLSTLHTNDAPSALTRMIDMGIEPYLLTSSVVGVLAQRLVRKVCSSCAEPYTPTKQELIDLGLDMQPEHYTFVKGKGCSHCFGSGYKGRHGIYELMDLTGEVKKQLLKSADARILQEIAKKAGMRTLREEGAQLVAEKITSTEEVLRVTREVEEL